MDEYFPNGLKRCVETEYCDSVAILRLNRPETRNSLSIKTLAELDEAFSVLESDPLVKTIVITGSGDTFASGADLNELSSLGKNDVREFALRGQRLMQKIYNSKKQTIGAINGYCIGGGLDLALSCRKRIALPNAVFAHPGANLGIITGWGGTQLLPRLVGEQNALEMFFTAKKVFVPEALSTGLVDEVKKDLFDVLAEL